MISGGYLRLDFRRIHNPRKRKKEGNVKVVKRSEAKMSKVETVRVLIIAIGPDADGGKTKVRAQYDYIDVTEAKPDEVYSIVARSLESASQRK